MISVGDKVATIPFSGDNRVRVGIVVGIVCDGVFEVDFDGKTEFWDFDLLTKQEEM